MRYLIPVVFNDHDGFASGVTDEEPTIAWPHEVRADDAWFEAIRDGGPPLYGVPIKRALPWRLLAKLGGT